MAGKDYLRNRFDCRLSFTIEPHAAGVRCGCGVTDAVTVIAFCVRDRRRGDLVTFGYCGVCGEEGRP